MIDAHDIILSGFYKKKTVELQNYVLTRLSVKNKQSTVSQFLSVSQVNTNKQFLKGGLADGASFVSTAPPGPSC